MNLRLIFNEGWDTCRAGARGWLVPIVFVGLIGYLVIVLLNADYMQEMGAADIPRNSAHVVYLMTAGQGFYMLFAWAWLFARIVTRDRDARLDEVVLSLPISLRGSLLGRYLGTVALGCALGVASPLGFLAVHPLGALGVLPADLVGPVPWFAMLHAWALFVVPGAFGLGAVFLAAAIKTRSSSGPFAVAAALAAIWMVAMVVLRGGEAYIDVASLIDPIGYAEVEEQATLWTPLEKQASSLSLTWPLILNRLLWGVAPLTVLAWTLFVVSRESLVLGSSRPQKDPVPQTERPAVAPEGSLGAPESPGWLSATLSEAGFHLRASLGGWGIWIAFGLLLFMGLAGSFVHVVAHAEGPLVPHPELLTGQIGEFFYLIIVFVVAGFAGAIMRRDDRLGFDQILAVAPAPLYVRVLGKTLAAFALTLIFCSLPLLAGYSVTLLAAPTSFAPTLPLVYFGLAYAPALFEVCGFVVLAHAVFRGAGAAHTFAMLGAFIIVLNSELGLVTYPPAKFGVPPHVSFSELDGVWPWLTMLFTSGLFKCGLALLTTAFAWLVWPSEWVDTWVGRLRLMRARLWGEASLLLFGSCLIVIALGSVLHTQLVERGGYMSASQEEALEARWEKRWLQHADAFEVDGGDVMMHVDPEARMVRSVWQIHGVVAERALHGELPSGVQVIAADVNGVEVAIASDDDHFAVPVQGCEALPGCRVTLEVIAKSEGWPSDGAAPWLSSRSLFATAADLLPRLGFDPERRLRAPASRKDHGLANGLVDLPRRSQVSLVGVAPAGDWRYTAELPDGFALETSDRVEGPLDFALVWSKDDVSSVRHQGVRAIHGPSRADVASRIVEDVNAAVACIRPDSSPSAVVQAPRETRAAVYDGVVWLPEDEGWDTAEGGLGETLRLWTIARAISRDEIARRAQARRDRGSGWLEHGVAGWLALECVLERRDESAWSALSGRVATQITQSLGVLDAPIRDLARDGDAHWIPFYSPLATFSWAWSKGRTEARESVDRIVQRLAEGSSTYAAVHEELGPKDAQALLGPPLSSDLAIAAKPGLADVELSVARWRWERGGWQPIEAPLHFVELSKDGAPTLGPLVDAVPESLVLDAWPSFERSIEDNRWPRKN
ncbi:MAG: hypothetical protein AAF735_03910 [Myxococcota bacterium]